MKLQLTLLFAFALTSFTLPDENAAIQDFQGKAYYFSQSKMDLGNWGARMSEAQKKQRPLEKQAGKNICTEFHQRGIFF
jgi:hypothetical protein